MLQLTEAPTMERSTPELAKPVVIPDRLSSIGSSNTDSSDSQATMADAPNEEEQNFPT